MKLHSTRLVPISLYDLHKLTFQVHQQQCLNHFDHLILKDFWASQHDPGNTIKHQKMPTETGGRKGTSRVTVSRVLLDWGEVIGRKSAATNISILSIPSVRVCHIICFNNENLQSKKHVLLWHLILFLLSLPSDSLTLLFNSFQDIYLIFFDRRKKNLRIKNPTRQPLPLQLPNGRIWTTDKACPWWHQHPHCPLWATWRTRTSDQHREIQVERRRDRGSWRACDAIEGTTTQVWRLLLHCYQDREAGSPYEPT